MVGAAQSLRNPMSKERATEGVEPSPAESAFEQVFATHYVRVVAVLFRLLGDRTEAEELANDVFWRAYRQPLLRTGSDGNVGGWLYRTATNLGIDAMRAAARRQQYEQAAGQMMREPPAGTDPLQEVLRAEKRRRARAVLATLKPAQAQILILRSSGFSYKELSQSLDMKLGSVGTMLARAEEEFYRRYLELHGKEEEL